MDRQVSFCEEGERRASIHRHHFPRRHETSLLLAIRAAVKQEDTTFDYLKHVFTVFRQSSSILIYRTLITVIAVLIFAVGVQRFQLCPYEQELPLFLVLEGAGIILKTSLTLISSCHHRHQEDNERNALDTLNDVLSVFVVMWTLTGSVWTFGIFNYVDIKSADQTQYCDKLVYMCSLMYLTAVYTCVLSICVCICVLSIFYSYKNNGDKKQLPYEIHVQR